MTSAPAAGIFQLHAEPIPEWHVSLPMDRQLAEMHLATAATALDAATIALPEGLRRLQVFAHGGDEVTFSAPFTAASRQPEAELNALLAELSPTASDVAFATTDVTGRSNSAWAQVSADFAAFLENVTLALAPHAWVKTHVGDQFVAGTVVRWPADLITVSRARLSADDQRLHHKALEIALATRVMLLRTLVLTIRGAAVLTTALATPLGPVFALPAAWKLINDIHRQARTTADVNRVR